MNGWDSGNLKTTNNYEIYLKNAFVCLKSAKNNNPNTRCILFVNKQPEEKYSKLFQNNDIEIMELPFSYFVFDKNYKWALAYYKLNVLQFLSEGFVPFDNLIMLDNDVYIKSSLDQVFQDCEKRILLYDIGRRLNSPEYEAFYNDLKAFYSSDAFPIILYGGEFIATNKSNLIEMMSCLKELYKTIKENNISIQSGDEFLISLFAEHRRDLIMNSANYIGRYWTGMYRIHSENSGYDYVKILHCPSEKSFGFLKIFKHLSKNKIITNKQAYRMLHLYHGHIHLPTILWYLKNQMKKTKK